MPPWGKGPVQQKIRNDPDYIKNDFPLLDEFETCTVIVHKPGDSEAATNSGTDEEESPDTTEEGPDTTEEGPDTTEEEVEEEEKREDEEEENEEEEVGRAELHNRREIREMREAQANADDPVEVEQRALEAAEKELGPFQDVFQIGAVVAGIILMVLGVAAVSRRSRKKKHKH
jgi:hypothetical protein